MIYFVQPVDGGPIKIGTTRDVDRRLVQLRIMYGKPVLLLATKKGGFAEEREIHARFAHLRSGKTEHFQPASDLMEFIGSCRVVTVRPLISTAIDAPIACKARVVADERGIPLSEYLSGLIEASVERDWVRITKKLLEEN